MVKKKVPLKFIALFGLLAIISSIVIANSYIFEGGKIYMFEETDEDDSDYVVATKGYVDSQIQECISNTQNGLSFPNNYTIFGDRYNRVSMTLDHKGIVLVYARVLGKTHMPEETATGSCTAYRQGETHRIAFASCNSYGPFGDYCRGAGTVILPPGKGAVMVTCTGSGTLTLQDIKNNETMITVFY